MTIDPKTIERMGTRLTAAWIEKMTTANPARVLSSGNVILPPARVAFGNIALPGEDRMLNGQLVKGKYGANLLFAPGANLDALRKARADLVKTAFPKNPAGKGLEDPIKDQGDRVAPDEGGENAMGKTYLGYVPGALYISPNANLDFPPGMNELVNGVPTACTGPRDELARKFYSGCWVIPTVNVFHGKNPQNPNVFFGLAGVLKIADDNAFSGGTGDGPAAFEGIQIDEDALDPTALFS